MVKTTPMSDNKRKYDQLEGDQQGQQTQNNDDVMSRLAFLEQKTDDLKKELKQKSVESEQKYDKLKNEFDGFGQNLQRMFHPAVLFSLLETAVYKSLEKFGFHDKDEKLRYNCSQFATAILSSWLIVREDDAGEVIYSKDLKNARKGVVKASELPEYRTRLTKVIHKAIYVFLEVVENDMFDQWPPDRNPLMHNGNFLNALYRRDEATADAPHIKKPTLDKMIEQIELKLDAAKEIHGVDGCKQSVEDLEKLIREKGLKPQSNIDWKKLALSEAKE
jgi:hypothetical protein